MGLLIFFAGCLVGYMLAYVLEFVIDSSECWEG